MTRTLNPDETRQLFHLADAETIGERIIALRRFYGMSSREVSIRAGLSTSVVWNLEKGFRVHGARDGTIERVADALGVTVHELRGEE